MAYQTFDSVYGYTMCGYRSHFDSQNKAFCVPNQYEYLITLDPWTNNYAECGNVL